MSAPVLVGLAVAGAVGAPARYLVDRAISARVAAEVPWGIVVVNVTGSMVLGLVAGAALYHGFTGAPRLWLGTGFCGAYTTFSTFTVQTVNLVERGATRAAWANVVLSATAGLAAAAAGLVIAGAW